MMMPLNRARGKTISTQPVSSCVRRQWGSLPSWRVNDCMQRTAVQKPILTTGSSAIAVVFSFHDLSSIHGNSWRRIVLRRHLLILMVRIAVIAGHTTNLGRKMWLLLGALAVMRLRRCIASHGRCYDVLVASKIYT